MASPSLFYQHKIVIHDHNGNERIYDFTDTPSGITEVREEVFTIPTASTVTIWNGTTDTKMTDFVRLILIASGDLDGEYVIDKGNQVGIEYCSFSLVANLPHIFSTSRAFANFTTDVFAGTVDKIEEMRVKNQSAVTAVDLQVLMLDDT